VWQSEVGEMIDAEANHDEHVGRVANTYVRHSVEPVHEHPWKLSWMGDETRHQPLSSRSPRPIAQTVAGGDSSLPSMARKYSDASFLLRTDQKLDVGDRQAHV
jgi:hypothetical protein